jgi:hypothetical protein
LGQLPKHNTEVEDLDCVLNLLPAPVGDNGDGIIIIKQQYPFSKVSIKDQVGIKKEIWVLG